MTVGRGETSAFDVLYRQLAGPVYRTALSVLRDPLHAEEVAQEVLLEVWRSAGRFDPAKGTAEAWVLTMARRRALAPAGGPRPTAPAAPGVVPLPRRGPIDRGRAAAAETARERRHAGTEVAWDQVSEAVQAVLERERLTYCLDKLSGPQRQVIMLAFYGGHTYTEVATILGIAVGTVKSRIRVGLARMRENMGTS